MNVKHITIICLCLFSIVLAMDLSVFPHAGNANTVQRTPQYEPISKAKLIGLSAVASFSPGIALLSIVYDVRRTRNTNGENDWLVGWLWLYWVIAFIDVTSNKIPVYAHVHHFIQYGLIWYVAYVAATVLGTDVTMLLGALTGTGMQAVRQGYHLPVAGGSLGMGTPIISTIEDVVTGVVVNWML